MCRHEKGIRREDCINCDHDKEEFEEWWGSQNRDATPPDIAEKAWFAAIRYLEREEFF